MKKVVSLAVLTALVAGCMETSTMDNKASYGSDSIGEEQLAPAETNINTNAYLMAAAPKYYIGSPYKIEDVQYIPSEDMTYNQTGIAGIIPVELNGSKTSDGETFDSNQLVATSKTLPLPSIVKVTNLDNGNAVTVRVNNRGPFVNTRIMDLSTAAAQQIGIRDTAKVQIQILPTESASVKAATLGETARVEQPAPVPAPVQTQSQPQPMVVQETTVVEQTTVEQAAPVAAPSGDYSVQVVAVYSEDNANALARELAPYGNTVVVHEGDMYKVRINNLDAAAARRTIDALRNDKGMSPGLLKAGKWVNADSI